MLRIIKIKHLIKNYGGNILNEPNKKNNYITDMSAMVNRHSSIGTKAGKNPLE